MKKLFLASLVALGVSGTVYAQCLTPPVLTTPSVCYVSANGGYCGFGDTDGIVQLPNEVVHGAVTVDGGRNVYVTPGHIVANPGQAYAMAFNHPLNVYVEGVFADANGQCDVFAVRNQSGIETNFTFQNTYAVGSAYNVLSGCHGDLIQNQGEGTAGGLNLTVENFVGVTSAQGLFIPHRSSGTASTTLRNVYIRMTPNQFTYPLLWLYAPENDPKDRPQTVVMDNVNVDWNGTQLYSARGTYSGDTYSFDQSTITGVVNKWNPVDDLGYPEHTGINYDRAFFCAAPAPIPPAPDPVYMLRSEFIEWCNAQNVRKLTCPK